MRPPTTPTASLPQVQPKGIHLGTLQKELIKMLAEIAVQQWLEEDAAPQAACEKEEILV